MKYLVPLAAASLVALVAAATAQSYGPMGPPMMVQPDPNLVRSTMMDDGSSSDFPTHMPGDFTADRLNRHVLDMNNQAMPMAPAPYLPLR